MVGDLGCFADRVRGGKKMSVLEELVVEAGAWFPAGRSLAVGKPMSLSARYHRRPCALH